MDETLLPIDIHYNKLLDWLQDRRHCSSTWQQSAITIRQKISAAIQDMPPVDEIGQLLQGTYINYFHCQRIMKLLKQTDGTKNIFGQYVSQRMKDWQEIIKLYEKDGIYLAEAAQMMARTVNYEIPALKKQIAKCHQLQQEYSRKELEYSRASEDFREKFSVQCRKMGIEGKSVKKELVELVKCLPNMFEEITRESRSLSPAIEYYTAFVSFVLNRADAGKDSIRLLKHVIEKGNTTVYEWQTGLRPAHVVEVQFNLETSNTEEEEGKEKEDEIDWGNLDVDDGSKDTTSTGGIVLEEEVIDTEIDWEVIDPFASGIDIEVVNDSSPEAETPQGDETASGTDALSVLDNLKTRNMFINELSELETFLSQRLLELSAPDSGVIAEAVFQSAPEILHLGREKVAAMAKEVSSVLGKLTTRKMADLLLIRNFPRYVDRLVEDLKKLTSEAERMKSMSRLMVIKREEALSEQQELEPKLQLMRQRMKELQKQLEGEISIRYKNRRVNIMGEINTV